MIHPYSFYRSLLLTAALACGATVSSAQVAQEPSNAAELAKKKSTATYNLEADAQRIAAMSPAEAAWEKILEENLGSFYLPAYKKDKLAGKRTSFDFVSDDPTLPRILIIGDSISRGYTIPAQDALKGKANVHRAPANCGPALKALPKLPIWLGEGKWDIILFNFGIHDRANPPAAYAASLEGIVALLQKTGAKLVWATSTPPADNNNQEKYSVEQCERVNRIATEIMQKNHIPVIDLHATVANRLAELQRPNNVHFFDPGYEVLGQAVATHLQTYLAKP